jgi:hypothetical protein
MATSIQVKLNEDIEALLVDLKRDYPALDYSEILKLALSDYYRRHKQAMAEEERLRFMAWENDLPAMELSDEEKRSIAAARADEFVVIDIDELSSVDV